MPGASLAVLADGEVHTVASGLVVESRRGQAWVTMRFANELVGTAPVQRIRLTPITDTLFADRIDGYPRTWTFRRLADGTPYLHLGGRLLPAWPGDDLVGTPVRQVCRGVTLLHVQ